jgi:hypothetical protein
MIRKYTIPVFANKALIFKNYLRPAKGFSDFESWLGSFLRLPFFVSYFLATLYTILSSQLPIITYQIPVYSYAIQIPFMWAVNKTEADSLLKLKDEYPEAFDSA